MTGMTSDGNRDITVVTGSLLAFEVSGIRWHYLQESGGADIVRIGPGGATQIVATFADVHAVFFSEHCKPITPEDH
jgi:hypothetical protein